MNRSIVLSTSPDDLDIVRDWAFDLELKLDWEHVHDLRDGPDLQARLSESGVAPERIRSVHLPPGDGRTGSAEMALTEHNRGTIATFVQEHLDPVPDAHLVVHPPKQFAYVDQLELIATMLKLTGRDIAVENTPDESDWYTPEAIALFGYLGQEYDRLDGLGLTIDTAHLPDYDRDLPPDEPNTSTLESLRTSLATEGTDFPPGFADSLSENMSQIDSWLPAGHELELIETTPYGTALRTLCLCETGITEIHLNDPITDGVPNPTTHSDRPLLKSVLNWATNYDVPIVLEPTVLDRTELYERATELQDY